MSNLINTVSLSSSAWNVIGEGLADFTIINTSTVDVQIAVADTTGNITGSLRLSPGDAIPLPGVPAGTFVYGRVPVTIKRAGQPSFDVASANVTVYKA